MLSIIGLMMDVVSILKFTEGTGERYNLLAFDLPKLSSKIYRLVIQVLDLFLEPHDPRLQLLSIGFFSKRAIFRA